MNTDHRETEPPLEYKKSYTENADTYFVVGDEAYCAEQGKEYCIKVQYFYPGG